MYWFLILSVFLFSSCTGTKLTFTGYTKHVVPDSEWVEGFDNKIIGIEVKISERGSVELSNFKTSFNDPGQSVTYNHRWAVNDGSEYLGYKLGLAKGYGEGIFPFVMPIITKDFERISVDLHWLPSVYILLFKIKF